MFSCMVLSGPLYMTARLLHYKKCFVHVGRLNNSALFIAVTVMEDLYQSANKTCKTQNIYLFPRGNEPLLYHQIGSRYFFIFNTNHEDQN